MKLFRTVIRWGFVSILMSALFAPIWFEIDRFFGIIIPDLDLMRYLNTLEPIRWLDAALLAIVFFSMPQILGTIILSLVINQSVSKERKPILSGQKLGFFVGAAIGLVSVRILYWQVVGGGLGEPDKLADWITYILWILWSVVLFSFVGWRLSLSFKPTSASEII